MLKFNIDLIYINIINKIILTESILPPRIMKDKYAINLMFYITYKLIYYFIIYFNK
jgi:hypothetical protein